MPKHKILQVGFDFHNVVVDSNKTKAAIALRLFNKNIDPEIFRRELVTRPEWGLITREQYLEIDALMYSDDLLMAYRMQPTMGSNIYIRELLNDGHNLFCITSSGINGFEIMKEYFRFHNLQEVKCFRSAELENKSPLAIEHGLDVFMDDDLSKLRPLIGIVPHLFLFSRGYNEQFGKEYGVDDKIITRIYYWEMFHEHIQVISTSYK